MNRDYLEVDVASLHSLTRSDPDVAGMYTKIISIHMEGKCSEIQEESSTRSRLSKMNRDYLDVDGASLQSLTRCDPDVGLYANIK